MAILKTKKENLPALIAYHVKEKDTENKFWTRIGAAWMHEDQEGLTLELDLMPTTTGQIVLRKYEPKKDQEKK